MTEADGKLDLFVLVSVFKQYCELGPKQRELFSRFIDGEDLNSENVAEITLSVFSDILVNSVPYLNDISYTSVLLDELEFLRYGTGSIKEDKYY